MNLDVMKTFCDLVETGSFSKAAEVNFVSQSAVSQQLAKIERDLSVQLISRGGGLVAPTEAGRAFYQGCKEILRRYEQLTGEVRSAVDAIRGVLRVGTIYSAGLYLVDTYIRRFLQDHPEVNVHVSYTHSARIYAAVIGGEMDLGVVAYPDKNRSIEVIPLTEEELVVVCPSKHRLAGRATVTPRDLEGENFVAFEQGIPTRRAVDRLLRAERVKVRIGMEFDNIELLKRAIYIEAGLSILPLGNVEREASHGDLTYVRFRDARKWVRPVAIIRHRGKAPTPAEKMFLGLVRSMQER